MTEPKHHDWPRIILEIMQALRRQQPDASPLNTLAKMIGRHHTQIERWIGGSEPRHFEGESLLTIHAEYRAALHVERADARNPAPQPHE